MLIKKNLFKFRQQHISLSMNSLYQHLMQMPNSRDGRQYILSFLQLQLKTFDF